MFANDDLILRNLSKGSEAAFRHIFTLYYSPLCEFASQYVSDDDSEELVQDLMVYVWEKRRELVIGSSLKSYLFTAVRNRCLNAIRKHSFNRITHGLIYDKLKEQFENPDSYMLDELAVNIEKAVAELPESYREVFSKSRFGDYSNKMIADELGISVKTVEYRMTRSLKILRAKLSDYLCLLPFLM